MLGSSGSLEVECALRMWKRSLEGYSLRYTSMFSDGYSKAYDAVCKANVCGSHIESEQEDCINHVAKWMGTALRKLASVSKAQKATITGKGKLTNIKIKKIKNYYGKAIKTYSSDVPLLHKCSMRLWEFCCIFCQLMSNQNMPIAHQEYHHGVFGREHCQSRRVRESPFQLTLGRNLSHFFKDVLIPTY